MGDDFFFSSFLIVIPDAPLNMIWATLIERYIIFSMPKWNDTIRYGRWKNEWLFSYCRRRRCCTIDSTAFPAAVADAADDVYFN